MEGFCRGCLIKYNEPMELLQYTEKNRRLFVYSTGLQVKRNDTFTFQLCKDCFLTMKAACKFKKQCRTSDRRFRSYLALQDVGEPIDFCTFLKNSDETLTFRLPLASGSSTPANNKRDDDNESTCTSIRNFMTDMLQGEEMPDTEARIIKEVIEEEADVLDDSLDSHWLQDDMSIDTDFRLDFSFSPFSTPRSMNNDHCYTPKKYVDQKEEQANFYTINSEKQTKILNDFTNVFKDKEISDFQNDKSDNMAITKEHNADEIDSVVISQVKSIKNESLKELCFGLDDIDSIDKPAINTHENQSQKELCDFSFNSIDKSETIEPKEQLCDFGIDEIDGMDKTMSNLSLPSLDIEDKVNIPNFYTPRDISTIQINDMSNSSINIETLLKDKPCPIDKNLAKALNTDNKEFSLDDLLVSPAYQGASGASTPTIKNILFGDKLDLDSNVKKHIGQCIETYDNVQGDIEIFEEFFQNDTKVFDLDEIKKGNTDFNANGIETSSLDGTKVDDKENESKNHDIDLINNQEAENNNTFLNYEENFDVENMYCKLCKKNFQTSRAFGIHIAKIHRMKIVRPRPKPVHKWKLCDACGKDFRDSTNFNKHLKNCMKPLEIITCKICKEEFTSQGLHDRHVVSHAKTYKKKDTGEHYICTICGTSINKRGNYLIHMRRHTKNYSVTCSECGKGFYRKSDLNVHMRQHTGDTPFSCKYCTRLFSRKDVLTRHVLLHIGQKLYECDNCGLKCVKKYDLKRHIENKSCWKERGRIKKPKEIVTVSYATGDDKSIKKQLPFLETERSN